MQLRDEYIFDAGPETVWDYIFARGRLAALIPACERLTQTGPDEYEALLALNLLFGKKEIPARLKILEEERPRYCRFRVEAEAALGAARLAGDFRLQAAAGKTRCAYTADLNLSGGLGKIGGKVLASSGQERIRRRLDDLNREIIGADKA